MINKYKEWLSVRDKYRHIYPDGCLNIVSYRNGLISEGEGLNFEVFVQGCMRHCEGCRNVLESGMAAGKIIGIKRLAQVLKDNMSAAVKGQEDIADADKFLEKIFLLFLESRLMAQRRLTLHSAPFKEVPYFLLEKAWGIKSSLLARLAFSLTRNELDSVARGKIKKKIPITGITFCGGEPLYQAENISRLIKEAKKIYPFKVWIMTGFTYGDIVRYKEIRSLLDMTDYLIDGPFMIKKMNLCHPMSGSLNQRIIDIKESLKRKRMVYWSPKYKWTRLFTPYWKKFSNPFSIQDYNSFINPDEAIFYLKNAEEINNIFTVKAYEKLFGDIRKNFVSRILYKD